MNGGQFCFICVSTGTGRFIWLGQKKTDYKDYLELNKVPDVHSTTMSEWRHFVKTDDTTKKEKIKLNLGNNNLSQLNGAWNTERHRNTAS